MSGPQPTKPLLRGVLHQVSFFVTLVVGAWLIARARPGLRAATAIYVGTLALQFGTSALYHRPTWAPGPRRWLRRCDHATIFLLIAGTATPIACVLEPHARTEMLWILWTGAFVGVVRAIAWITAPKWIVAVIAIGLGCICFTFLPEFGAVLDSTTVRLLVSGGLLYIVGAITYALRRPNPWPRVFGYHEIFHVFTIIAAACDVIAIARVTT